MGREESRKKKFALWVKLWKYLDEYKKVLVVKCSNVSANLFQEIRQNIRPLGATILMGKNTLLKAGMHRKMEEPKESDEDYQIRKQHYHPMPELEKLVGTCKGYVGLVFCRDNLSEVKDMLKKSKCIKGAKVGAISPCDVVIQPGPTGLDPKQTAFFQALNIQTKIVRTQIEIITETKVISKGQKISASECALLDKLNIRPYVYELSVVQVYDNGVLYSPTVLDIGKAEVIQKLRKGASYLTAAAMQTGYPTTLSVKQLLLSGFKNMLSLTLSTEYTFKQAQAIKSAQSAAAKHTEEEEEEEEAPKTKGKKDKEPVKEKEPEKPVEEIGGFGNIFGDDG